MDLSTNIFVSNSHLLFNRKLLFNLTASGILNLHQFSTAISSTFPYNVSISKSTATDFIFQHASDFVLCNLSFLCSHISSAYFQSCSIIFCAHVSLISFCFDGDFSSNSVFKVMACAQCLLKYPLKPCTHPIFPCSTTAQYTASLCARGTLLISGMIGVSGVSSQVSKHRAKSCCTLHPWFGHILFLILGMISHRRCRALLCLHVSTCS